MTSIKFPAGKYFVGDVGYVASEEQWKQVCHKIIEDKKQTFRIDGVPFAVLSTAYGDGIYEDDDENCYYVDSGTLGCIPVEAMSNESNYGRIIEFTEPFTCSKRKNGFIRIGHVFIDTAVV
jgi:hypothetical protein